MMTRAKKPNTPERYRRILDYLKDRYPDSGGVEYGIFTGAFVVALDKMIGPSLDAAMARIARGERCGAITPEQLLERMLKNSKAAQ